jgi:ferredoxin
MHAPRFPEVKQVISYEKIKTEYYDVCRGDFVTPEVSANRCMSCATCRDCKICEATCYWGAISRVEHKDGSYEYVVDDELKVLFDESAFEGKVVFATVSCCGGGVLAVDEQVALGMAKNKLDHVRAAQADAMVLICPFCDIMYESNQSLLASLILL